MAVDGDFADADALRVVIPDDVDGRRGACGDRGGDFDLDAAIAVAVDDADPERAAEGAGAEPGAGVELEVDVEGTMIELDRRLLIVNDGLIVSVLRAPDERRW